MKDEGKRRIKYNVDILDLSDWVNGNIRNWEIVEEQSMAKVGERYADFEIPGHHIFFIYHRQLDRVSIAQESH